MLELSSKLNSAATGGCRVCLGCAWDVLGVCLGCAWGMLGMCLGYARGVLGVCSGCAWDVLGVCLGCARGVLGVCLGCHCVCGACLRLLVPGWRRAAAGGCGVCAFACHLLYGWHFTRGSHLRLLAPGWKRAASGGACRRCSRRRLRGCLRPHRASLMLRRPTVASVQHADLGCHHKRGARDFASYVMPWRLLLGTLQRSAWNPWASLGCAHTAEHDPACLTGFAAGGQHPATSSSAPENLASLDKGAARDLLAPQVSSSTPHPSRTPPGL